MSGCSATLSVYGKLAATAMTDVNTLLGSLEARPDQVRLGGLGALRTTRKAGADRSPPLPWRSCTLILISEEVVKNPLPEISTPPGASVCLCMSSRELEFGKPQTISSSQRKYYLRIGLNHSRRRNAK